jgi:ABC-type transport system involved in cytochrome c biogenesis permease subunit
VGWPVAELQGLESLLLKAAVLAYFACGAAAIVALVMGRPWRAVQGLMTVGLAAHTLALALRWARLGHGPYTNMYEILSSNIWSMLLVFAVASWRYPVIRPGAVVIMPVILLLLCWMLLLDGRPGHLPPTYDTAWLYVHVTFAKIFSGALLVCVALAGIIMLRRVPLIRPRLARLPADPGLDELCFRFLALALVFHSLMLVAGAIWAQSAWGRYWAWDPLETWSFFIWLLLAFTIHLRVTFRPRPALTAGLVMLLFALSFLNFFGVPFVSEVPHRGVL